MKKFLSLVVAIIFTLSITGVANADQLSDLKAQMKALQKDMQKMQKKINDLEGERDARISAPKNIEDRIAALEDGWIRTDEGDLIQFGGELQVNYIHTQETEDNADGFGALNNNTFDFEEVEFKIEVKPQDNIELTAVLDFDGNEHVSVDQCYMEFEEVLPYNGSIFVGLQDRFIAEQLEAYTELDPLPEDAFYDDPDIGIQYYGEYEPFYWHASLTQGMELDDRSVNKDAGTEFINSGNFDASQNSVVADETSWDDINSNKQIGTGIGYKDFGEWGTLDLLGFLYLSRVTQTDLDEFLTDTDHFTNPPNRNADSDKHQIRTGLNLAYTLDELEAYAQAIFAKDAWLSRFAWFAQASYVQDIGWQYLQKIQPVFRVGQYFVYNTPEDIANPLTWDRSRITLGLLNYVRENIIVKTEYAVNFEDTGTSQSPHNNELIVQLNYEF